MTRILGLTSYLVNLDFFLFLHQPFLLISFFSVFFSFELIFFYLIQFINMKIFSIQSLVDAFFFIQLSQVWLIKEKKISFFLFCRFYVFDCGLHSAVHSEKVDAFCLFQFFSFLINFFHLIQFVNVQFCFIQLSNFHDTDSVFDGLAQLIMGNPSIFFSIQLSNFHDVDPRFDGLTCFEGLTQFIQIFVIFLHQFFKEKLMDYYNVSIHGFFMNFSSFFFFPKQSLLILLRSFFL